MNVTDSIYLIPIKLIYFNLFFIRLSLFYDPIYIFNILT